MARVTVEDCLEYCKDRFYLVLSAAQRAHRLESGTDAMVEEDNDKPTVLALREIAGGFDVDQDEVEVAAREEEDRRLAERFMAVKRGDDMADAMSFLTTEGGPEANMPDIHFSEHFGMTPDSATPLPDDLDLSPKPKSEKSEDDS